MWNLKYELEFLLKQDFVLTSLSTKNPVQIPGEKSKFYKILRYYYSKKKLLSEFKKKFYVVLYYFLQTPS